MLFAATPFYAFFDFRHFRLDALLTVYYAAPTPPRHCRYAYATPMPLILITPYYDIRCHAADIAAML